MTSQLFNDFFVTQVVFGIEFDYQMVIIPVYHVFLQFINVCVVYGLISWIGNIFVES